MKNFFLVIFASISILTLSSAATAQLPSNCRVVRGQIYCDEKPTAPKPAAPISNGCMQNPSSDYLYPISPLQLIKKTSIVKETAQSKTYAITDFYGTYPGTIEIVKATHTVTVQNGRDYMHTLVSKGHSLVPGFSFGYPTHLPGETRGVHKSEFDCISSLTADEAAAVSDALRVESESGLWNDFTTVGPIFRRIR